MSRKDWEYTGDVDLKSGGMFYQLPAEFDADSVMIRTVEVTDLASAMGGPDCMFLIESGYAYLARKDWQSALDCCGWKLETRDGLEGIFDGFEFHPMKRDGVEFLLQAINGYKGIEDPDREVVQIGKLTEYDPDPVLQPDSVIRGNWKLENYVARHWL